MRPQPHAIPDPILDRFRSVRECSARIAAPLSAEDRMVQSMPDASPTKWHLAHTTWFFETFVLRRHAADYELFHPAYEALFNSYYHAVGAQFPRAKRGMLSRPSGEEIEHWRAHVDAGMARYLARGAVSEDAAFLIELGLQHEQQHQELMLTDLKHALFQNPLRPAYRYADTQAAEAAPVQWIGYAGGMSAMGYGGTDFAFDNECPRHETFLAPFHLASRLVTNAEYLAFVEAGGYARPEFWLADGWARNEAEGRTAPLYWWREEGGAWVHFTHSGPQPLPMDAPVAYIDYYEADAFAHWSGARLPTEAEWEHAAEGLSLDQGNFLDLDGLAPCAAPPADGLAQMYGDVWEWTSSSYRPHPGYRPFAGMAAEYNGKFMSGQMVLKGGSCLTPLGHLRASYRNFFPPGAGWQCSGIRLAKDVA